mgnify:CR=1 FL=1
MDLTYYRNEIDKIDDQLVQLFAQRMEIAAKIADYKKENNLPILMPSRERAKLQDVAVLQQLFVPPPRELVPLFPPLPRQFP